MEFKTGDYKDLSLNSDDWLYLDPPYHGTSAIYHGGIDLEKFYDWLEIVEAGFALSFDGRVGSEDQEIFIPDHLYQNHLLMKNSNSSFRRLKNDVKDVYESLYVNYKNHEQPITIFNQFFE